MDKVTELQRLEQFVEKLLISFAELKEEKKNLLKTLKDKNALIVELEGKISTKDSERTEISERVGKLVEQIEDWELGLDEDEEELESMDEEAAGDDVEDAGETAEAGRLQHNLFSVSGSKE
jgi:predicted nuclease with TOPRIM domain